MPAVFSDVHEAPEAADFPQIFLWNTWERQEGDLTPVPRSAQAAGCSMLGPCCKNTIQNLTRRLLLPRALPLPSPLSSQARLGHENNEGQPQLKEKPESLMPSGTVRRRGGQTPHTALLGHPGPTLPLGKPHPYSPGSSFLGGMPSPHQGKRKAQGHMGVGGTEEQAMQLAVQARPAPVCALHLQRAADSDVLRHCAAT